MTKMHHFSASQIDEWLQCPRKWAWKKIDRVQVTPNRSAELGTRIHGIIERFYIESKKCGQRVALVGDAREREIAYAALPFLPDPLAHGVTPEEEWRAPASGREYGWTGRVDVTWRKGPVVEVHDLKTCSSFAYVKDLDENPQAILYAWREFARDPHLDRVDCIWTYTRTKEAPLAKPKPVTFSRESIVPRAHRLDAIAQTMYVALRTKKTALELEPNLSRDEFGKIPCERYGGCPHVGRCNLSPSQLLIGLNIEGNKMSNGQDVLQFLNMPQAAPAPAPAQMPLAFAQPAPAQPEQGFTDISHLLPRDANGRITHAPNGLPLPPHIFMPQVVTLQTGQVTPLVPHTHEVAEMCNAHAMHYAQTRGQNVQPVNSPEAAQAAPGVPQAPPPPPPPVAAAPEATEAKKGPGRPKKNATEAAPQAAPAAVSGDAPTLSLFTTGPLPPGWRALGVLAVKS